MTAVAAAARVPVETLRKIESGRVPTPAFFTIAALTSELDLALDDLAQVCSLTAPTAPARSA